MLVILNWPDEITHMITPWIVLHSVKLLLQIWSSIISTYTVAVNSEKTWIDSKLLIQCTDNLQYVLVPNTLYIFSIMILHTFKNLNLK